MQPLRIMAVLCLCASTAFGQQKDAVVMIDPRPVTTDSLALISKDGPQFGQPTPDGKFIFHIKVNAPEQVSIMINTPKRARLMMLLDAGDSVSVTDAFGSPVFSGKGAGNSRAFAHLFKELGGRWNAIDKDSLKTPDDLYRTFENMFNYAFDYLEAHKQEISPSAYNYLYTTHYYRGLNFRMSTPFWYRRLTDKPLSQSIPKGYWSLSKETKFDDKLLQYEEYREFLMSSYTDFLGYQFKINSGRPDGNFAELELVTVKYRGIEKNITGKSRQKTLSAILEGAIGSAKDASVYLPLLKEYEQQYGKDAALNDLYNRMTKLAVGKKPDPFTLRDINGKDVTLNDFTGKVIYLDFWASWCGPCRAQMKEGAPKLHNTFKDNKDLVFLYINMDDKADLGKAAIKEDNIEGIHLFSGGFSNDNPIAKAFNIHGIPRYVIIGKDGTIVDNDAPRPSEAVTAERLHEALRK